MITASVVSHDHGDMVPDLVDDLLQCPEVSDISVILNVPETISLPSYDRIRIVRNESPRGYGANQNAAFQASQNPFFCVLNADIRLNENPFPCLLACLQDETVAMCAPIVVTPHGQIEDSARQFPTVIGLALKAAGLTRGTYQELHQRENPDWLAGMFLLMRSSAFREVGGFDERFFLYYEDVDLCRKMRARGYHLRQVQEEVVIHSARRSSRRDLWYAKHHFLSMAKYLCKGVPA